LGAEVKQALPERGAAVVEFALVSTLLFTVLMGMLQYGLYFNDALGTRNGVREAARQGIVQNFEGQDGSGTDCTGNDMQRLKCLTKGLVDPVSGTVHVKVVKPNPWQRSQPLVVCAMVKSDGVVGLLPLPNGGWISSKTQMSVENDTETPSGTPIPDPLPAGTTWDDWCP
jgi:TadE-like protein